MFIHFNAKNDVSYRLNFINIYVVSSIFLRLIYFVVIITKICFVVHLCFTDFTIYFSLATFKERNRKLNEADRGTRKIK